jgi:O-antigen ligase
VPAVYSLNRGLWLACAIGIVYVAFRLAVRGRTRAVRGILAALALAALLFVATPLGTVFSKRLHHQKSNDIRTSLTVAAIKGALTSPIIGYGTDRQLQGATQSIAIGKSASCTQCGNFGIGSNGQLWLMLFAQGFPGAAFYMLFFLVVFFRSWRDYSAIGTACTLILLVSFLFDSAYSGDGATLAIYMIAAGLLWRNRQAAREGLAGSVVRPAEIPA